MWITSYLLLFNFYAKTFKSCSFNNVCKGAPRTLSQLKSQWTTTKIQAKKEIGEQRRNILKTGGGPQPVQIPVTAEEISVWLPNEFITDVNEYDCDAIIEEVSKEKLNI